MAFAPTKSEREILEGIAAEYDRQGYEAVLVPAPNQLPDFLKPFRPDLILRGKDETIVVELKRAGPPHVPEQMRGLAEEISKHPGWRFQIVVVDQPEGAHQRQLQPPKIDEIRARVNDTSKLYDEGNHAAALLLLWSLFEAAAWHRLDESGSDRRRSVTPIALIKDLVSFGLIDQRNYEPLRKIAVLRNEVAHGFPTRSVPKRQFSRLKRVVESLLQTTEDAAEFVE